MGLLGFYFSPVGRIGRRWFWLGFIGLALIEAAFNYWLASALFGHDWFDPQTGTIAKPARQLILLVNLIFLFPFFVVLARRFHDRGKGAIWTVPFLVTFAALVVADIFNPAQQDFSNPLILALGLIYIAVFLWIVVELGCLKGSQGANRFGPDPLAR